MFNPRPMCVALVLGLLAGLSACQPPPVQPQPVQPPPPVQPQAVSIVPAPVRPVAEPVLIHLPGVSGESSVDHALIQGLRAGAVVAHIQIYDWTCDDPGIPALHAYFRNQQQAQKIADLLTEKFRADPARKIYLTSHSGGGALAVWALEKLPPDVEVETLLLLAPALSPTYDLSKALAHVRGKAYVFYSYLDTIVLSYGTRVFGTMDGVYSNAAGLNGFVEPPGGDPARYAKLVQEAYDPDWVRYGNIGDHIGWTAAPFARAVLAPLLNGRR
jgi:pimeloyl-ACP methyl ester carboxylesterase